MELIKFIFKIFFNIINYYENEIIFFNIINYYENEISYLIIFIKLKKI